MFQSPLVCSKVGSVLRAGRGRVNSMISDSTGEILAVHGFETSLELFQFLSESESKEKLKKRLRKERSKALKYVDLFFLKYFQYLVILS